MPQAWRQLLQTGPTPFAPEQWVLIEATGRNPRPYCDGQLAFIDSMLTRGLCVVTTYTLALAGGWRPSGYRAVAITDLTHATVEAESSATDGGDRVRWAKGPTALTHTLIHSLRDATRQFARAHTAVGSYTILQLLWSYGKHSHTY